MTKSNEQAKTQAEEIFQKSQALSQYAAIIRAMDNNIYDITCSYDVIDHSHSSADKFKKSIDDLISLNAILLTRYETDVESLVELADSLSGSLLQA